MVGRCSGDFVKWGLDFKFVFLLCVFVGVLGGVRGLVGFVFFV